MTRLATFWGIVVSIFMEPSGKHHRPHFHAFVGGESAIIAIDDGKIISGDLPITARHAVRDFWKLRRVQLQEAWDTIAMGRAPRRIAPPKRMRR